MFTTAIQNDILKLVIGMFKASVGGKYLQDFRAFVEAVPTAVPVGGTKPIDPVVELAKTLQTKAEFLNVFPASQSNVQFQDAFLNYFSLQNNTEARAFVSQKLAAGLGRGEVILEAVRALDTYTGPDAQIKSAQTFLTGKFNLAFTHSVSQNVQELALSPLQAVLIGTDLPPVPIPSVAPSAAPAPAPAAPSPITNIQTIVEGVLSAGPVIAGNQLEVSAFGNQGQLLGTAPVGAGGTYSLSIPLSYTGPILVRVFDKGTSPDYLDEATGQPRDLDTDIRAVSNIPFAGGTFQVNLNPLTELAVRTVGLQSGDSGASQTNLNSITAAQIAQANQTVANAFGLTGVNLTGGNTNSNPNLIVNADGTPNPNANTYGRVLASLSGAEAGQGQTTGQVLDQFLNSLNQNNGSLGTEARQTLIVGSINVDPTGNRGVSSDVGRTQGNSAETQAAAQATYVKLGQLADKVTPAPTVTLQELLALGITGIDAAKLPVFLKLVAESANSAAVNSFAELQAIANRSGTTVQGDATNKALTGSATADVITGGAGEETITGGGGADTINAGAGNDTIVVTSAAQLAQAASINGGDAPNGGTQDALQLNTGTAALTLADADLSKVSNMEILDLAGTGAQTLTLGATPAPNANTAFASGITIKTQATATSLTVNGSGLTVAATVTATNNSDTITTGSGADNINAGAGNDNITAGKGNDRITTGAGSDTINISFGTPAGAGTAANPNPDGLDTITDFTAGAVANGGDNINLTGTSDIKITADATKQNQFSKVAAPAQGAPAVQLTTGFNVLTGTPEAATVADALAGKFTVAAGDTLYVAVDIADVDPATPGEQPGVVIAKIVSTAPNEVSAAEITPVAQLVGVSAANLTAENFPGFTVPSLTIQGDGTDKALTGDVAADVITGGSGNEVITGAGGADQINGGAGNDTVVFSSAAQLAQAASINGGDAPNGGTQDALQLNTGTAAVTLGDSDLSKVSNMEILDLVGTGAQTLTLGAIAAPNANSAFASGITIKTQATATSLTVNGAGLTVAATITATNNADNITTGSGADVINTGDGDDIITAGAGNDEITGGKGNDTFNVDAGTDTIKDLSDSDVLKVSSGATATATVTAAFTATNATQNNGTATLTSNGFNVDLSAVTTGANGFTVSNTSTTQGTTIKGSAKADVLTSSTAADILTGGLGADTLNLGGTGTASDKSIDTVTYTGTGETGTGTFTDAGSTANMDVINNLGANDLIKLYAGVLNANVDATISTSYLTANTANNLALIRGTYNEVTKTFTAGTGANDDDYMLQFADGTTINSSIISNLGTTKFKLNVDKANSTVSVVGDGEMIVGDANANTLTGKAGDTMTGAGGNDTFNATAGTVTITDLSDSDILNVSAGATANATVTAAFVAGQGTQNNGTATLTTNGFAVDLTNSTGTNGFSITNTSATQGANITGSINADVMVGSAANDILIGGGGADVLTGNAGVDTYQLGSKDNAIDTVNENGSAVTKTGQAIAGFDLVEQFAKGQDVLNFNSGAGKQRSGTYDAVAKTFTAGTAGTDNDVIVFIDTNNNGIVDAGESAVVLTGQQAAGAAVDLNGAADGTGFNPPNGTLAAVTATSYTITGEAAVTVTAGNPTGAFLVTTAGGNIANSVGNFVFLQRGTAGADSNLSIETVGTEVALIYGLGGNDSITGTNRNDTLVGGDGDDTLLGGAANDLLIGDFSDIARGSVDGGDGTDTFVFSDNNVSTFTKVVNVENLRAEGTASVSGELNDATFNQLDIVGTGKVNVFNLVKDRSFVINGGDDADRVSFFAATTVSQTISGGAGNDTLEGGSGADSITGGTGADTINLVGTGLTVDTAIDNLVYTATAQTGTGVFVDVGSTTSMDIISKLSSVDLIKLYTGVLDANTNPTISTTYLTATTANNLALVRGNFNSTANTFTAGATSDDDDFMLQWADGTNINSSIIKDFGAAPFILNVDKANNTVKVVSANDAPVVNTNAALAGADLNQITFTATDAQTADTLSTRLGTTSVNLGTVNNGTATTLTVAAQLTAGVQGDLNVFDGTVATNLGLYLAVGSDSDTVGDNFTQTGTNPAIMFGFSGLDSLTGGDTNDTLIGGAGNDILSGGKGNDVFVYNTIGEFVAGSNVGAKILDQITGGDGTDTIILNADTISLLNPDLSNITGVEILKLGKPTISNLSLSFLNLTTPNLGIRTIDLSADTNAMGSNSVSYTSALTDTVSVIGSAGNDFISTSLGIDILTGGDGSDSFRFAGITPSALQVNGNVVSNFDLITDYNNGLDSIDYNRENASTIRTFLLGTVAGGNFTVDNTGKDVLFYARTSETLDVVTNGDRGFVIQGVGGGNFTLDMLDLNGTTTGNGQQISPSIISQPVYSIADNTITVKAADPNLGQILSLSASINLLTDTEASNGRVRTLTYTPTEQASNSLVTELLSVLDGQGGAQSTSVQLLIGTAATNVMASTLPTNVSRMMFGFGGNDDLYGSSRDDTLVGGVGNDLLEGVQGKDVYIGGEGDDTIVYKQAPNVSLGTGLANATLVGGDRIIGFDNPGTAGGDVIRLSKAFFGLTSAVGNGFSVSTEFASVANDDAAEAADAFIVLSQATGNLFYNASNGAGDSTVLATLVGVDNTTVLGTLTAGDFSIIA